MKPLELRIHEKHPTLDAYRFGPSYTPYAIVAVDKRFTDAELAAEYWQEGRVLLTKEQSAGERFDRIVRWAVLHRFATLPHYDEDDQ